MRSRTACALYPCLFSSAFPFGQVWKAASDGNKGCVFHTELAAQENTGGDYRVGVGISRTAGTLLAAIEQLRDTDVAKIIRPEVLQKADLEAKALEPYLAILNAGKGSEESAA